MRVNGFVVIVLCVCVFVGCGPSMKDAVRLHKQGQKEDALAAYRSIAKRSGSREALDAQLEVVKLLTQTERWRELPSEAEKLASFLDPDDEWARRHKSNPVVWESGRRRIGQVLLTRGRAAYRKAREVGDPVAYIASGRLYGLYVERFSRNLGRIEAAAGRGVALAIRGDCGLAMKLFEDAARWAVELQSAQQKRDKKRFVYQRPLHLDSREINQMLYRGSLGCRILLWQERHAQLLKDVKERKRKLEQGKALSDKAFVQVQSEALRLIRFVPREGAVDLIRHATMLQRGGNFSNSLRLLLVVMDESKMKGVVRLAESKALRAFGATRDWEPLLDPLRTRLVKIPAGKRSLFWRRVQQLVVLHSVRQAQEMLKERKPKEAAALIMTAFRESSRSVESLKLFYRAAIILEEKKQLAPASKLFRALFEQYPKHRMAPMALYRHAAISREMNKLPDAASAFELLANSYPNLKVAPRVYIAARALFESYMAYRRMGAFGQCRKILRWLFKRYPRALSTARMRVHLRRYGRPRRLGPRRRRRLRRRRLRRRGRQQPPRAQDRAPTAQPSPTP